MGVVRNPPGFGANFPYDIPMEIIQIRLRFDGAAAAYDRHDALEREVGKRLLERVGFARRPVESALDLGCGTGRGTAAIQARFEAARVTGLDISGAMLAFLRERARSVFTVQGDFTRLPFAARSQDLVYSNLALQWASDFEQALSEIRRTLRPGGMLLLSVPGAQSLRELRLDPGSGSSATMPIYLPDLQELGDLLVSTGFGEPVMDSEVITLSYANAEAMKAELNITGGAGFMNVLPASAAKGPVDLRFEVIYGTAFGPPEGQPIRTPEGEIATFSVDQLRKRNH